MVKTFVKNDYSIITSDITTVILSWCNGKSDSVVSIFYWNNQYGISIIGLSLDNTLCPTLG